VATTNPRTVTLVASTAQAILQLVQCFPTVVIDNSLGTAEVYVRMDGTAAVGLAANNYQVPPNSTKTFSNPQPQPNANSKPSGVAGSDESESIWTVQANAQTYAGGFGTNVSVISTGTPDLTRANRLVT
jgi:hypothetical protein